MHPPVRLLAIDVDGTLLPSVGAPLSPRNGCALVAAQRAGIRLAIATGRRTAYTTPLLAGLPLRADTLLLTSNGAVLRTLAGEVLDRCHMEPHTARTLCALLRPFGSLVFTFDRTDRPELVLEDMHSAQDRIALWIEANRNAIQVVSPLESAFPDSVDPEDYPIQGMVAGPVERMRSAEAALRSSPLAAACECVRTEYPTRNLSILDLLPTGVSKGSALRRLAARLGVDRAEVMAIGDNWNDLDMLEWAGQAVLMGNAASELRILAKTRGWRLAPPCDHDGVADAVESAIAKLPPAHVAEECL